MSSRPGASHDPLAEVLHAALTNPDAVDASSVDLLSAALRSGVRDQARAELALAALAALLYSRPDLVPGDLLDQVAELLYVPSPSDRVVQHWRRLWEALAATPAAPRAWTLLTQILQDERVDEATRALLVPLVGSFVQWREDLVDLDGVLALAACARLATHRAVLLDHTVERLVFRASEEFTPDRLERLNQLFQNLPRYKYVLYALAGRPGLPTASRATLTEQLGERFPFQRPATAIFTQRPFRLLAVHNAAMGQGDDLVRIVPLLQALLDANPALSITLVTQRRYLYDNPRVVTIPIKDEAAVDAVLQASYDGVIEFFQPGWRMFNYRMELHDNVEKLLAAHPPAFLAQGDMGRVAADRPGKRSQFLHQKVVLDGHDIAGLQGLDRLALMSSYDPGHRLLAELGLPQRAAEEPTRASSLLTGARSVEAERIWSELVPPGDGPVALVSPFGGSFATKGFSRQDALVAAELEGLVSEGYRLVVLPQDQEWARPAAIEAALALLGPATCVRIRIAPDPADPDVEARLALTERPDLPAKDRVVRLFKYFASCAELIVTVEGWLAHLAYLLGRPFRLFVAAGSFDPSWFPHGRGPAQRLVAALSPQALPAHSRSALLAADDPAPVPHFPRRVLLEIGLAGLGRSGFLGAGPTLRRVLASPDGAVRAWAAAALGQLDPIGNKAELIPTLEDLEPRIVRESASALLRSGVDCSRELGSGYRTLLQAYVDGTSENWEALTCVGPSVLPVLMQLAKSASFDVRCGAREALRPMLSPWVPGLDQSETMPVESRPWENR
jgi:hypothetical protein